MSGGKRWTINKWWSEKWRKTALEKEIKNEEKKLKAENLVEKRQMQDFPENALIHSINFGNTCFIYFIIKVN